MPSTEEPLTAWERAIRLQNRERAVQRALYVSSQQDLHDRIDGLDMKFEHLEVKVDALEAKVDAGFAALEADNRANRAILREQFKS